jgi:outer membrane protein assembly factor BamD (BamD/ComL family)
MILTLALVLAVTWPVMAQKAPVTAKPVEPPKPLTRPEKAHKMNSDAFSLRQTSHPGEAAAMYESLIKQYPTSELVPGALVEAFQNYLWSSQQEKADAMMALVKKNFSNSGVAMGAYWIQIETAFRSKTPAPLEKRIALLEDYVDRYWGQPGFATAVQYLAGALLEAGQTDNADALLSHVLIETSDAEMGNILTMIQRGSGGRQDFANQAKLWGAAVKDVDHSAPVWPVLRLLETRYQVAAGMYDEALQKTEVLIRERPKSEYAAYCALELKPDILAKQKKFAEAAAAIRSGMESYGIFVLLRHWETLAGYEADAGNYKVAVEVMNKALGEPKWPIKQRELLEKKEAWLVKAGDFDGAIAVDEELAKLFPQNDVGLNASLRVALNQLAANHFEEAKAATLKVIAAYKGQAAVAAAILPISDRFEAAQRPDEANAVRTALLAAFPASLQADECRKKLDQPTENTPTTQATALFDEYASYAKEGNVEAARRRIDKLFVEFPSSACGADATTELGDALKKAEKTEQAAELYMLLAAKAPYHAATESRLVDAGAIYTRLAKPVNAFAAYDKLVKTARDNPYWRTYIMAAAEALSTQDKLAEAKEMLDKLAQSVGGGPIGTDIEAYMARRFEGQEKWKEAADEMLRLLGENAANPAYRPLTAEAYRFIIVSRQPDKEAKLLENLAAKYEAWDEADRVRLTLVAAYARNKEGLKAVKMLDEVQKRHTKYEIGNHGPGMVMYLGQYSGGLYSGTVGYQPMDRVTNDMSGGYENCVYTHRMDDLVNYILSYNDPQGYLNRVKAAIAQTVKAPNKRPTSYKSGLPYKTRNVPKPQVQPTPEQRRVYHLVEDLETAYGQLQQRLDPALWLEVYPCWPNYYRNDERIRAAACALYGKDNGLFDRAVAILKANYNELTWVPNVLYAQAIHDRDSNAAGKGKELFQLVAGKYPDHELAPGCAAAAAGK